MDIAAKGTGYGRHERVVRQVLELGHPQVGDGDEVLGRPKAPSGGLGLLQQAIHCLDEGIAAAVEHAPHHAVEALDQGQGQAFERFQPAAPRPGQPGPQCQPGRRLVVARHRVGVHSPQCLLQSPGPRALQVRALQPVHGIDLLAVPVLRVLAHGPEQAFDALPVIRPHSLPDCCRRGAHLVPAHGVHRFVRQGNDMEAVIADAGLRQGLCRALGVGRAHVHADVLDRSGVAPVSLQVVRKGRQRSMVAPGAGEEQALGIQIMDDRDVLMPLLGAGLVNTNSAHAAHVILGARQWDVMGDSCPKPFGRDAHQVRRLAHRQLPAQRQSQSLEQQGEAAAFPRPRHRHLGRLAAAAALDAGDFGMQPGFVLEEVEVAPAAGHTVMDALVDHAAGRAGHALRLIDHLEVDTALRRVEFDVFDCPGRLQAKGRREQGFDGEIQGAIRQVTVARIGTDPGPWLKSNSTGNGIEPLFIACKS